MHLESLVPYLSDKKDKDRYTVDKSAIFAPELHMGLMIIKSHAPKKWTMGRMLYDVIMM